MGVVFRPVDYIAMGAFYFDGVFEFAFGSGVHMICMMMDKSIYWYMQHGCMYCRRASCSLGSLRNKSIRRLLYHSMIRGLLLCRDVQGKSKMFGRDILRLQSSGLLRFCSLHIGRMRGCGLSYDYSKEIRFCRRLPVSSSQLSMRYFVSSMLKMLFVSIMAP